jgi:hypothetical protein
LKVSRTPPGKNQGASLPFWNLKHSWLGAIELGVAVGIAYYLAARLGLALKPYAGVAFFWPAAGIVIGVLIVVPGKDALSTPSR